MPQLTTVTLGKFCRELACGLSDDATLLKEWGLTPEQYKALEQSQGLSVRCSWCWTRCAT
jgi:hypothetical protein